MAGSMGWLDKRKGLKFPPNEVFPVIDVDRISKQLGVDEKGIRNGRNNIPENSRPSFDATEKIIVDEVAKVRRKGLSRFGDNVQVYRDRIGRIEGIGAGIREAADSAEINFRAEISARRDQLNDVRKDFNEARDELKNFQERNRIFRAPYQYKGVLQWWAISIIILALETALNGVFFSEAHVKGLIGGATIALVISVVNIGVATISGHFFRDVNHVKFGRKLIGFVSLIIGLSIAVVGNFSVGHFRDAAIDAPLEQAPGVVFERLASGQYLMESLDAWLLIALGLLIAAVAGWKAYTITDPYPGYGRVGQKYYQKRQEWRDLQEETLTVLKDTRDYATQRLKQHQDEAQSDINNAGAAYQGLIALQSERASFLRDCDAGADHLLKIYREANEQTRETPAPAYFLESFRFPPEQDPVPPGPPDREAMKRFREMVDQAVDRIHEECSKALSSFENADATTDGAS